MKEQGMGKDILEEKFKEFLNEIYYIVKPLDFRKEAFNFRTYGEDGLCKIINFQRNKWNKDDSLEFVINIGIYFREDKKLNSRKFKEYECAIRRRIENNGKWWRIDCETDVEALCKSMEKELQWILKWFEPFESKDVVIRMILNGTAEKYSDTTVFHYQTAKMLANMGYAKEVYHLIKDSRSSTFIELKNEIYDSYNA